MTELANNEAIKMLTIDLEKPPELFFAIRIELDTGFVTEYTKHFYTLINENDSIDSTLEFQY